MQLAFLDAAKAHLTMSRGEAPSEFFGFGLQLEVMGMECKRRNRFGRCGAHRVS